MLLNLCYETQITSDEIESREIENVFQIEIGRRPQYIGRKSQDAKVEVHPTFCVL